MQRGLERQAADLISSARAIRFLVNSWACCLLFAACALRAGRASARHAQPPIIYTALELESSWDVHQHQQQHHLLVISCTRTTPLFAASYSLSATNEPTESMKVSLSAVTLGLAALPSALAWGSMFHSSPTFSYMPGMLTC